MISDNSLNKFPVIRDTLVCFLRMRFFSPKNTFPSRRKNSHVVWKTVTLNSTHRNQNVLSYKVAGC
jgi:hypothetical protein